MTEEMRDPTPNPEPSESLSDLAPKDADAVDQLDVKGGGRIIDTHDKATASVIQKIN